MRTIDLDEPEIENLNKISPLLNEAKGLGEEEEFVLINPDRRAFRQLVTQGVFSESLLFELVTKE